MKKPPEVANLGTESGTLQGTETAADGHDGLPPGRYTLMQQTLRCAVGPLTVLKRRYKLHVWNVGLITGLSFGADFSEVSFKRFSGDGFLFRSLPISQPLPRALEKGMVLRYVPDQYERYYVDLTGGVQSYLAKFSSKSRSTLRRKVRRFSALDGGKPDFREYRSPADLASFYPIARSISKNTYQERQYKWGLPESPAFEAEMLEAAGRDEVRGYLLFCRERPVAYLYCTSKDGILSYEYVGYDTQFASYSPGTVLLWLALERILGSGDHRLFDFTQGMGEHKRFFATGSQLCADVYLLPRTRSNQLSIRSHMACADLRAMGVRLLDQVGVKPALKRWYRRVQTRHRDGPGSQPGLPPEQIHPETSAT